MLCGEGLSVTHGRRGAPSPPEPAGQTLRVLMGRGLCWEGPGPQVAEGGPGGRAVPGSPESTWEGAQVSEQDSLPQTGPRQAEPQPGHPRSQQGLAAAGRPGREPRGVSLGGGSSWPVAWAPWSRSVQALDRSLGLEMG